MYTEARWYYGEISAIFVIICFFVIVIVNVNDARGHARPWPSHSTRYADPCIVARDEGSTAVCVVAYIGVTGSASVATRLHTSSAINGRRPSDCIAAVGSRRWRAGGALFQANTLQPHTRRLPRCLSPDTIGLSYRLTGISAYIAKYSIE